MLELVLEAPKAFVAGHVTIAAVECDECGVKNLTGPFSRKAREPGTAW